MLKLVKITENTWRLRMSCIFIATKAIPGKHKNLQDEICMHGQKQFQGLFLWSIYSSWHVLSFFNVLIHINLQSTYLLEWNSFVLPRFLPSRMCMGLDLHCISSSIMCFAAQNSQFQSGWLYLGEELVTVCFLSNLLSSEGILVELWWHVYQYEANVDQNKSYLAEVRMLNFTIKFPCAATATQLEYKQTRVIHFLLMQVSIWPVTIPSPRLTAGPLIFSVKIPAPGQFFSAELWPLGRKNKIKSPPPGITSLVQMSIINEKGT